MTEIQNIDLAGILSNAETIKGQRNRNRLDEILNAMKAKQAQREFDMQTALQEGQIFLNTLGDVSQLPEQEQQAAWANARETLRRYGSDDVDGVPELYDPQYLQGIQGLVSASLGKERGRVGSQEILADGTVIQSTPQGPKVFSPSGELLQGQAAVDQVRNARQYEVENQQAIYGGRRAGTLGADIELGGQAEGVKEAGKGGAQTRRGMIDDGLDAVGQISNLTRTLDLLGQVKTGGVQSTAGIRIKQMFGIEGADEGELSANLGKAVLSQLRTTFGAAFTEREGERLERIEAGFGKSTETNIRLIQSALDSVIRTAKRGLRAAERDGDDFAAEEIRSAIESLEQQKADVSASGDQVSGGDQQPDQAGPNVVEWGDL